MIDAAHQSGSGLVAGADLTAREEVVVIAMCGWIRELVAVRRTDSSEFAVMSREIIHGSRLETVHIGIRVTRTGQGCPCYTFMLAVLTAAVDRAECGGGARRQRDQDITTRNATNLNRRLRILRPPCRGSLEQAASRIVPHQTGDGRAPAGNRSPSPRASTT